MKRNTIIFIINWWAKRSSPVFLLIGLSVFISCRKEGDFNVGSKAQDGNIGIQFTDTLTLLNKTFLLNDSIISARATYLSFGGYDDPDYTGKTYCEAYASLGIVYNNRDYSGVIVDSANLYMYYYSTYGDTLSPQDFEVHQITTQLDASVPYQTTSNFVTYDPTIIGEKIGYQAKPHLNHTITIPMTNAFATNLLSIANNKNTIDFQNQFYGIVIKPKNNSVASVVTAQYTDLPTKTRLTVYYKRGQTRDSTIFAITGSPSSFNRVITDRSGTNISSLVSNKDNISPPNSNNRCYIQSGSGVVTKVEIPFIKKISVAQGSDAIIVNKAILVVPIDDNSYTGKFKPEKYLRLLQMNPNNTYKYASNGQLAYVQGTGASQLGTSYYTWASITDTVYRFDITSYIQALLTNQLQNDGFILMPLDNSYLTSRSVVHSANATEKRMRLEIYYTKVK